jgi:hypothetical protein
MPISVMISQWPRARPCACVPRAYWCAKNSGHRARGVVGINMLLGENWIINISDPPHRLDQPRCGQLYT